MFTLRYSQVSDAGFAHGTGDGFHRCAQGVEQRGELPGTFGLPPLLHHEAGHGHHVGVEGSAVGHVGGRSAAVWELRVRANAGAYKGGSKVRGGKPRGQSRAA